MTSLIGGTKVPKVISVLKETTANWWIKLPILAIAMTLTTYTPVRCSKIQGPFYNRGITGSGSRQRFKNEITGSERIRCCAGTGNGCHGCTVARNEIIYIAGGHPAVSSLHCPLCLQKSRTYLCSHAIWTHGSGLHSTSIPQPPDYLFVLSRLCKN